MLNTYHVIDTGKAKIHDKIKRDYNEHEFPTRNIHHSMVPTNTVKKTNPGFLDIGVTAFRDKSTAVTSGISSKTGVAIGFCFAVYFF